MPSARPATAAPRRHARTPPARPGRVVPRAPRLRIRWDRAGRIGLLIVFAIVVGLYVQHTLSYLATSSQASSQQATVTTLERQNSQLLREQQSLSNPATIVQDARALGMVRPNERPYVMTGQPGH